MSQAELGAPLSPATESSHPDDLVRESVDTAAVAGAAAAADDPVAALAARVDGMRDWASETKSQIRALVSGFQILDNRVSSFEDLRSSVDLIGQQVGELSSLASPPPDPIDRAVGYQPSIEQQCQLFAALAEWQTLAKPLEKGHTANIPTKSGGSVSYRYADIAQVSDIARSAGSHGLAHFHREIAVQGQPFIRTYLVHKAGGWISCDVPLLMRENTLISSLQQWASACTMARRYGLFMVLGIAAGDEDDDGASAGRRAQANQPTPSGAKQAPGPRSSSSRPSPA